MLLENSFKDVICKVTCDVCAHSLIGGDLIKAFYVNAFIVVSFLPLLPSFPGHRKGAWSLRSASRTFFPH